MNATELKEKIVKTILLKAIMIKELNMYNKMEGQCMKIYYIADKYIFTCWSVLSTV